MTLSLSKFRDQLASRGLSMCLFDRHTPDREAAQWDGRHYVSHCLNCGCRVRRKAHNDWRSDWLWQSRAQRKKAAAEA